MQPQALLILLALAAGATTSTSAHQHRRSLRGSSPATCRLETGCENQPCSATAYEYDAATAGIDFPYSVSYTTTADGTTTSFVFLVCSQANALGGCTAGDPGCSPLATFQLRTRDDQLSRGTAPTADPAGTPWATCDPQGPGYKWEGAVLGNLSAAGAPSANDTCQTFTLATGVNAGGEAATLADVCQQNITVVDTKDNSTVVDSSAYQDSCLYTMILDSGRTAYGLVGVHIPVVDKVAPPRTAVPIDIGVPSGGPTPYGPGQRWRRRSGPTPYGRRPLNVRLVVGGRRVGRLF